jgi:hypothetical protein
MQKIFMDYVGKFQRSKAGHNAILVCVDAFTKFVLLCPVKETTSKATIKVLREQLFSSFSVPEVIVQTMHSVSHLASFTISVLGWLFAT